MSRSGYSDDCENLGLYRAAVNAAIYGKRGQAFIRELSDGLDAMPAKRLTAEALEYRGEVCALGVVGLKRGIDLTKLDSEDPDQIGAAFNIARSLAAEVAYENDEASHRNLTPEERWARMRKWAAENLLPEKPVAPEAQP